MNLTFKGFLRQYCRELSGLDTDSLKKLCAAAVTDAPRLAEPLFLLAAEEGRLDYLMKAAKGTSLEATYARNAQSLRQAGSMAALLESEEAPERLRKVRRAFEARREAGKADRRIIELMRKATLDAMKRRRLTAYRVCKTLGLNLGNVYAYLGKGDVSKVSRNTARRIMEYATG